MNSLRIIFAILLPLAATWLTYRKRHLMLVHPVRSSLRQRAMGGGLLLMLMFSIAPAWYEMWTGPWGRYYWFDRFGFFIMAAFIIELLFYRGLHEQWKRSVLFKGAMQVPICGCILTILIWGHDRYQRSKYRDPAEPSAPQSGSGIMRMIYLRRRRRLAIIVDEMMTLCSSRRKEALISLRTLQQSLLSSAATGLKTVTVRRT